MLQPRPFLQGQDEEAMTTTPTMLCLTEAVLVILANFTASEMSAGEAWTYRPALK